MAIIIKFIGGVRTVTGSSHMIMTERSKVILDAGLFLGHRDESYAVNTTFPYNPRSIDALLVSHAHVDHCGNLPSLVKKGFNSRIYSTFATRDLCKLMLEDSGKIQEEDIRYVNKINKRMGQPPRRPLYTIKEARKVNGRFRPISYEQKFCVTKDISAVLYDAGHILGSSIIVLDIQDGQHIVRLGYAVDLGRKNLPLLNDPVVPRGLDYLILESTYGGRTHAPIEEAKGKLRDAVNRTVERNGKIIIPAFTLERTQEVLYFLNELLREKAIPPIPVFVDSPLATDITDVFKNHLTYMNDKTRQAVADGNSPFEFLNLTFIREQRASKGLNMARRPMIIIAGNGMCEAGRVLHHLKNNIEDSRNTVLVVGFMAKDTLGRRIVDRVPFVKIFGVEYQLNAEVVIINAFSGHADKNDFLDFAGKCFPLRRIFLVHGDEEQSQALFDAFAQKGWSPYLPAKGEEVAL
ncbi:MAG: MBL fold metallo-hydrolase [Candidatus Omnitrophota bacterium]|jgi:metallo-beta-lactamase family protein